MPVTKSSTIQNKIISFRHSKSKKQLQVLQVTLTNRQHSMKRNGLLDCGSDSALTRHNTANQLKLKEQTKVLNIQSAFLNSNQIDFRLIELKTSSLHHPSQIQITKV